MKLVSRIKQIVKFAKADYELRKAIIEADNKSRRFGVRYYVLPNHKHKLISRNYGELKRMRQLGMFSARCTIKDFTLESFYFTGSKYEPPITEKAKKHKRDAWLKYVATYR